MEAMHLLEVEKSFAELMSASLKRLTGPQSFVALNKHRSSLTPHSMATGWQMYAGVPGISGLVPRWELKNCNAWGSHQLSSPTG